MLASHVIEHVPDPIAALLEWIRVARRYVFLVVPHRDRTFDRDRPITPLEELVERHRTGFASDEDRHWTVWNYESFLELCEAPGVAWSTARDPDSKGGERLRRGAVRRGERAARARSGTRQASAPGFSAQSVRVEEGGVVLEVRHPAGVDPHREVVVRGHDLEVHPAGKRLASASREKR